MAATGALMSRLGLALALVVIVSVPAATASAVVKYKVLHDFAGGSDGGGLFGAVTVDAVGNLYGVTSGGGAYEQGTVFKLTRSAGGKWTERVLHSFYYRSDGNGPMSNLILDAAGNLYGVVGSGGPNGAGTAFELSPDRNGTWMETKLYSFCSVTHCTDGSGPTAGLIQDAAGNLYGTTQGGGKYGEGVVFELTPISDGWTESVLYSFCFNVNPCTDGDDPYAGVSWDSAGNLYGTTKYGGKSSSDYGTAFELKHNQDGSWQHQLLHSFPAFPRDGRLPYAGLVVDKSGSLYGATLQGGSSSCETGCGTVFKLTHNPVGGWKENTLYRFPQPEDGAGPASTLTLDQTGDLYGTASGGTGCNGGCGVVFKLTPGSNGNWEYSVVHKFNGQDGAYPNGSVTFDSKGNLYGTTELGGAGGYGVVFEITP